MKRFAIITLDATDHFEPEDLSLHAIEFSTDSINEANTYY